ncbi:MAG: glycosyltransferase family 2 protein [Mucilaginibacter sp.]
MKLTVIIANHNSCKSLRVALTSLFKAAKDVVHEVMVVDNASSDRSLQMLAFEFPQVRIIANSKDEGISKAYNKAMRLARGEYIWLLNAESVSGKDTIGKLTDFMDEHPMAGGISVRMVDYKGDYLPESKHSLGKTWVTFLGFVGMSSYFPKSSSPIHKKPEWAEEFAGSETDVLNPANMLLRKSVLNETGLFDERFFKFGHNIDLSYRIRLKGYKNYYYSKTYIIQLQGQFISKFSWDHIKHFYGAMFIFAAKYLFKRPVINVQDMGELFPSSYEIE